MKVEKSVFTLFHEGELYKVVFIKKSRYVNHIFVKRLINCTLIYYDENNSTHHPDNESAILLLCEALKMPWTPKTETHE